MLKALLRGDPAPSNGFHARPAEPLLPLPPRGVPLWLGSWGSAAGLRRVARLGDGWLASAYNTDPQTPFLHRDPAELRDRLCVGSASMCAELLSRYAEAGCRRVHFWPLGEESRQLDLLASEVLPRVTP